MVKIFPILLFFAIGTIKLLPNFALLHQPRCLCSDGKQRVTFPFQNPVGVGRYNVTRHEKYPRKIRYQSLYQSDTQRYLSNLKQDAYLL